MEEVLNKKEKQLVYLSASIASGCHPCTKYHLRKSMEAGLTDIEINKTLALAISIRDNATNFMGLLAHNQKTGDNMGMENQESLNRDDILVGIAASYSINFPVGLEKYLSIARNIGVSNAELNDVISLSKFVIDKARAHADMVTDKIGVGQTGESKNEKDCCSSCDC